MLYQEKTFELPLEHDVIVTGRMDQVNRIEGNQVEIIDYKTGRPKDAKAAAKDMQLGVYALAAEEVLDLDPVRLVFYNLMTNEAVAATRDAKALRETKEKIAEVADQIRAREFSAKPGFVCGFCDYKPLCPAHEQLISIRHATERKQRKGKFRMLAAPDVAWLVDSRRLAIRCRNSRATSTAARFDEAEPAATGATTPAPRKTGRRDFS